MSDDDDELMIEWEDDDDEEEDNEEREEEDERLLFQSAFEKALEDMQRLKNDDAHPPPSLTTSSEVLVNDPQTAATLEGIQKKTRLTKEYLDRKRREKESKRAQRQLKIKSLQATVLGRIAIGMNLNVECDVFSDQVKSHIPPDVFRELCKQSTSGFQQYLAWIRRTFRRHDDNNRSSLSGLSESIFRTKQGSESTIVQLLVAGSRAARIPSRLVIRFTQGERFEDDDVWAEVLLPFASGNGEQELNCWHRVYATAARVMEAEEEVRQWEKRRTVDPSSSSGLHVSSSSSSSNGRSNNCGGLCAVPRRLDSKPSLLFILAFGEMNHLTLVTARYSSNRSILPDANGDSSGSGGSNPIVRLIVETIREWNATLPVQLPAHLSSEALKRELAFIETHSIRETTVPTTLSDLGKSAEFVLERNLKQTDVVRPGAKPVNYFKGEAVYRREQVSHLLNEFGWKRLGRVVRDDARDEPRKVLPLKNNLVAEDATSEADDDETKSGKKKKKRRRTTDATDADDDGEMDLDQIDPRRKLYDESQTVPVDPGQVDPITGEVPRNEYGNIELWCREYLPRGGIHIVVEHAAKACEDLKVPFASALVGFDFTSSSGARMAKPKPRFLGVVVAEKFATEVRRKAGEIGERMRVEREEQERKSRALLWRDLLEAHVVVMHSTLGPVSSMASSSSSSSSPINSDSATSEARPAVPTNDGGEDMNDKTRLREAVLARMAAIASGRPVGLTAAGCEHEFKNGSCVKCHLPMDEVEYF